MQHEIVDGVTVGLLVDGRPVRAAAGISLAAALAEIDAPHTRTSLSGAPRFAVCGIGVCQECRICVNGQPHVLACRTCCRDGMVIATGRPAR